MVAKLKYNPEIAKLVRKQTMAGATVTSIFAQCQKYKHAPRSYNTFYKHYGHDLHTARAATVNAIGGKVVEQALYGDEKLGSTHKARELYLRTQAGWSPRNTTQHREVESEEVEAEDAIRKLMFHLNIKD